MKKLVGLIRFYLLRDEMRRCIGDLDCVVPNLHKWK